MKHNTKSKNFFYFIKSQRKRRTLMSLGVILVIIFVILVFYSMLYSSSKDNIINTGKLTAVKSAEEFDRYLSRGVSTIELVGYNIDEMLKSNDSTDKMHIYLKKETNAVKQSVLEVATGIYAYVNDTFMDGSGWQPTPGFDPKVRPWYINAMEKKGEIAITDPYIDANTGSVIVSLSKQLSDGKSIVAIDILMNEIQTITEELSDENDGSIECVLDSKGNVISHSDKSQLGKCYTSDEEKDTIYAAMSDIIYDENRKKADDNYFELHWNNSAYIVYTVSIQDRWVSVSMVEATDAFLQLTGLLVGMIMLIMLSIAAMLFVFGRVAKREQMAAKLNSQLSSSANIYMFVCDVNMKNGTYSSIKNDLQIVTDLLGSSSYEPGQVQQLLNYAMTQFTNEKYIGDVLTFIDLSTLNSRMKNTDTLTIEYLAASNKWRKGRWIVSERTDEGDLSHVLYMIEDIDAEKRERDIIFETAKHLSEQISSVSNIYMSMYDIDIINDTYKEINVKLEFISDAVNIDSVQSAQEAFINAAVELTSKESREAVERFLDFSTLDERVGTGDTITLEFLGMNNTWCRGRFIVSKRTEEGKISHVLWLVENIDKEKRARDMINDQAQLLSLQLDSLANIYLSVFDINIIDDTYTEIKIVVPIVNEAVGSVNEKAQEAFYMVSNKLTADEYKDAMQDFMNFSTLNERIGDAESVTIEFMGITEIWCRGRFIVSERTEDGRISHVLWVIEDIDKEKKKRDVISEKANQLTTQLRSAVNIYTVAYDIDVINDTFKIIHTTDREIEIAVAKKTHSAKEAMYLIMKERTDVSSRKEIEEYIDISTINERMADKDVLAIEYRNARQRWRRARFIVSERTADDTVSHVLLVIEDIDEEKKIRDELYDIANKLNTQLSSIGDIYISVFDINVIDDTYAELKSGNTEISDITSIKAEDSAQMRLFKNADKFADSSSVNALHDFVNLSTLNKRLKNTKTIALEYLDVYGHWCRARFIASQWTSSGKLSNVLWTVEDINDEKTERDKLVDISEKAIAASAAKSAFLSNMSHEIRTPINAVLGMNEMVLRECDDKNVLAYSESIKTAGNTLLGIINDILDFSKIESGKMEIIPVDYDLASVLNDLVNMVQTRADDKGLILKLEFDHNIPQYLNGDEIRIKQVITNILTNAVKYTKEGTVTFGMSYEKIQDDPDHINLNVYVKDTGIGIKEEDMAKLFSEFERIDEKNNRNIEGTGLGMNITQSLLSMMGSTLKVQSIYTLGSLFSFSLKQKVIKWDAIGDYEKSYRSSINSKKKYKEKFTAPQADVLIIDDTPMNLMVFKSLLKQTKVQIDTANNGDEGISAALEKKYDIIFLDHMMPKKDGIQTLREMKSEPQNPNLDTPVVCLTANAISGAREQYLEAGFDDYLTKPINPVKLEDMLMHYIPEQKVIYSSAEAAEEDDDEITEESIGENTEEIAKEQKAAPKNKSSIPSFVYDIDEIDVEKGLRNCVKEEIYINTLHTYANMVDDNIREIEELYNADNITDTVIKIHALKSTSRIIGAADLGELAQQLENAGHNGDTEMLADNIDGFLDRCRRLSAQLSPLKDRTSGEVDDNDAEEKSGLPRITEKEYSDACGLLKEFAAVCDNAGIMSILDDLKGYDLSDEQKNKTKCVRDAAEKLEYESISEILDR